MTDPTINSLLERQITSLEANLNRRLDATERNVSERFDRQDRELEAIRVQTTKTNGRVTALETARTRAQGVMAAFRWLPVVLGALLSAGITILVMALSGGIHVS